jgi:hypothetical protein
MTAAWHRLLASTANAPDRQTCPCEATRAHRRAESHPFARRHREPAKAAFVVRSGLRSALAPGSPGSAYICVGWHTPGLDGREARYGRDMETAIGPQAAENPHMQANSNRSPRLVREPRRPANTGEEPRKRWVLRAGRSTRRLRLLAPRRVNWLRGMRSRSSAWLKNCHIACWMVVFFGRVHVTASSRVKLSRRRSWNSRRNGGRVRRRHVPRERPDHDDLAVRRGR